MVTPKMETKKVIFWTEKKVTCDTSSVRKMHILVLSIKTEICNLAKKYTVGNSCCTIIHHKLYCVFIVHICVLIAKTNIC